MAPRETLPSPAPGVSFGEAADSQYDPLSRRHCVKGRLRLLRWLPMWPESPGSTSIEELDQLIEAHVKELIEVDPTVGEFPKGPLLRLRTSHLHSVRSIRLLVAHNKMEAKRSNQRSRRDQSTVDRERRKDSGPTMAS
ncbi:hypothetical protein GW17_00057015 [Ensete ventricosum]|nr:hypothetical protein GW17_00057015 [Ensete ventricosum]